jgi:hypothetical protein
MDFRGDRHDEPEINLIPFIDVLLVILIFLMLSTTYSKFTELQVNLPAADAEAAKDRPAEIIVAVSADGRYAVDRQAVEGRSVELLAAPPRRRGRIRSSSFPPMQRRRTSRSSTCWTPPGVPASSA